MEGYAYLDLPSKPGIWNFISQIIPLSDMCTGSYEMDVATWRPTGRRFTDRLMRFFIGGPPEVDDITYVACRKDFKVRFLH